ncbi:MAG: MarR family transcriptional regulator [Betaproteobacteria bacterium]|nr:MarR family transcriptional regulator [Betaproteobacteria bacterium]
MPRPDELQSILKHWREAVPEDRLAHLIRDAARAQARALQMRLLEHAVSFGHWSFLRILWEANGLTQSELSARAGVMEPTTYAAVTAMERLGLVRRRQLSGNRKNVHVYLTPKGRALRSKLIPLAEEVNRISVGGVSAADVATTRRVLLAMLDNLAGDGAAPANSVRRVPSTRELSRLPARAQQRARKSAPA